MTSDGSAPARRLSVFDSTCILVGIIVGIGIYETAPIVAGSVPGAWGVIGIWLAGGVLALTGALCYAELATTYPREGGDYVYLTRAYGRWCGFLFAWVHMTMIRPADVALLAFVFARYAQTLYPLGDYGIVSYAVAAVVVLSAINIAGVKASTRTQNVLTVVKAIGLALIIAVGLGAPGARPVTEDAIGFSVQGLQLGLILVLFTYGGWNEMGYVAAEVKRPERTITRALVIGTLVVTVLYVLANGAFLHALGHAGMAGSEAVAVDTVAAVFPEAAGRAVSVVICISALGAMNGLLFTGARISYALGTEHRVFSLLGRWDPGVGTPMRALVIQGGLSVIIIVAVGSFIDTIIFTAPLVWIFFLATACSLFVLRRKEPWIDRPYRVTAYPVTPAVYCACCLLLVYSSFSYAISERPLGLLVACGMLLVGALVYVITQCRSSTSTRSD